MQSILAFGNGNEPGLAALMKLGPTESESQRILDAMYAKKYIKQKPGAVSKQDSLKFLLDNPTQMISFTTADDNDTTEIMAFEKGRVVSKKKTRKKNEEKFSPRKGSSAFIANREHFVRYEPGKKIEQPGWEGHYIVEQAIGIGKYGEVYKVKEMWERRGATSAQQKTEVIGILAMKCVNMSKMAKLNDPEDDEHLNLCQEASLMAKVGSHVNVNMLRRVMQFEDTFLVLLDLVEGENLQHLVSSNMLYADADPAELVQRLLKLALQLANALEHCHSKKILHQDVKPANVMIHKPGTKWLLKLADFGLSAEGTIEVLLGVGLPIPGGVGRRLGVGSRFG